MTETTGQAAKKKNWFRKHKVLTGVLVIIALIVIGASTSGAKNTASTTTTTTLPPMGGMMFVGPRNTRLPGAT